MEIKKNDVTYIVSFKQKGNTQRTPVVGVSCDDEITGLIRNIFKGRFRKPDALSFRDGVAILIRKIDSGANKSRIIMNTRVYNKSVRQARIAFEMAIR